MDEGLSLEVAAGMFCKKMLGGCVELVCCGMPFVGCSMLAKDRIG